MRYQSLRAAAVPRVDAGPAARWCGVWRRWWRRLAWTLVLPGVAAWAAPAQGQSRAAADSTLVLQPNDAVRVTVWQHPELSGEFTLAEDGTIRHPLYRTVHATDIPIPELERRLRQSLQRFTTEPEFLVEPLVQVTLGGDVRLPNLYRLPAGTTLAQAVALAGGPSGAARGYGLVLVRDGRRHTVDLAGDALAGAWTVRSGDQLLVPRRRSILQEYVGPAASLMAAVASAVVVFRR